MADGEGFGICLISIILILAAILIYMFIVENFFVCYGSSCTFK